jgi:hypothetical protein
MTPELTTVGGPMINIEQEYVELAAWVAEINTKLITLTAQVEEMAERVEAMEKKPVAVRHPWRMRSLWGM